MHLTGEKTTKDRVEDLLEDLIAAVEGLKQEAPVINVESPAIVFPEQKAPVINFPEQKPLTVLTPEPAPRKRHSVRVKLVRNSYGGLDHIDIIPLL